MSAPTLHPRAVADAVAAMTAGEHQWRRMEIEALAAEIELSSIMPGNTRADYVRVAALAMHLAGRFDL